MNPLWAILFVNILALFGIPFLTYYYAHKNNLKILKEKWISELRNAATEFLESCTCLYYANDVLYQRTSGTNVIEESIRSEMQQRRDECYACVTASNAKIRLLFKEGDSLYKEIQNSIEDFISSVDNPTLSNNLNHMDLSKRNTAQDDYLKKIGILLHKQWSEITK